MVATRWGGHDDDGSRDNDARWCMESSQHVALHCHGHDLSHQHAGTQNGWSSFHHSSPTPRAKLNHHCSESWSKWQQPVSMNKNNDDRRPIMYNNAIDIWYRETKMFHCAWHKPEHMTHLERIFRTPLRSFSLLNASCDFLAENCCVFCTTIL